MAGFTECRRTGRKVATPTSGLPARRASVPGGTPTGNIPGARPGTRLVPLEAVMLQSLFLGPEWSTALLIDRPPV